MHEIRSGDASPRVGDADGYILGVLLSMYREFLRKKSLVVTDDELLAAQRSLRGSGGTWTRDGLVPNILVPARFVIYENSITVTVVDVAKVDIIRLQYRRREIWPKIYNLAVM